MRGLLASVRAHYAMSLFGLVFLLPTLIAGIYYGAIASDSYVSETRFVVRSIDNPASEGAAAYLQDFGIRRANDDTFAIHEFIHSRDAMHEMQRKIDLQQVWSRPDTDFWSRYDAAGATDETLFDYYKRRVRIEKDNETGITTIKASAFRASDARDIAEALLRLSEARINEMNARARNDSLSAAGQAVDAAAQKLAQLTVALTRYRNQARTVDPTETADAIVERSSALEQELAQLQVSYQTMRERAPGNPAIAALRQRVEALSAQVAVQKAQLSGAPASMTAKLGDYEDLMVQRELAEKAYEAAQKQFTSAQEQADRQRVYLETISRPNLPDEAQEPRRLRYIFTVALLSFWTFLIFYLLVSGSREHMNVKG